MHSINILSKQGVCFLMPSLRLAQVFQVYWSWAKMVKIKYFFLRVSLYLGLELQNDKKMTNGKAESFGKSKHQMRLRREDIFVSLFCKSEPWNVYKGEDYNIFNKIINPQKTLSHLNFVFIFLHDFLKIWFFFSFEKIWDR